MAQVEIMINGRAYMIHCEDGQEEHVARLGRQVDQKVAALAKSIGQVGDARLLVMASLMIADELSEADALVRQAKEAAPPAYVQPAPPPPDPSPQAAIVASAIESLAGRIEAIAAELERH